MLTIRNLSVEFSINSDSKKTNKHRVIKAVNQVSLKINQGETLAVVGESGSGKSQLFNAVMGLLPKNSKVTGTIEFFDQAILKLSTKQLNKIRGKEIGMIFQDPMTALNPYLRIGKQLTEIFTAHQGFIKTLNKKEIKALAIKTLERVQFKDAVQRFNSYPHELSGGMRQRVTIAMALMCKPKLIIADEPTTALDVTTQTEIIRLLKNINENEKTSIILIAHDLPLVTGLCDRIAVMYAGRIVENGSVEQIFNHAKHPYTQALLKTTSQYSKQINRMQTIDGLPFDPLNLPRGCSFSPRCSQVMELCINSKPPTKTSINGHQYSCFKEYSESD